MCPPAQDGAEDQRESLPVVGSPRPLHFTKSRLSLSFSSMGVLRHPHGSSSQTEAYPMGDMVTNIKEKVFDPISSAG